MTKGEIAIADRKVGPDHPPLIIVEVAQAHDGSLGAAHAFIDVAADCGADAIKFQTHIAEAESTLDEPFRVRFSLQDETRYDYWRRTSFTAEQWAGLADHARRRGMIFLSSAFSRAAVELLDRIGMPAWKIGSGETVTGDIIDAVIGTGAPLLVSTGMSYWSEIDQIAEKLQTAKAPFALFQCTSRYPSGFEQVGLNVMEEMRARYICPVGLSDHTGSIWPAVAAVAKGADLIEVHLTLHEKAFGPDAPASLVPDDLSRLCEARDAIATFRNNPVDKDAIAEDLAPMRSLFSKSLAPSSHMEVGHQLTERDITLKKPGTGLSPQERHQLIGRKLARPVSPDRLFVWDDLQDK